MSDPVDTQPERTALAWQRTGLGVLAVGGLLGHAAVRGGRPAVLAVAGVVALLGLGLVGALAPRRYRRVRQALGAGADVRPGSLPAVATAAVVLTAAASGVAVLTLR